MTNIDTAALRERAQAAKAGCLKETASKWSLNSIFELSLYVPVLADDLLALVTAYEQAQARISELEYDLAAAQWLRSEAGLPEHPAAPEPGQEQGR